MKEALKRRLPERFYRPVLTVWRRLRKRRPTAAALADVRPVSTIWGLDRGTPIAGYYIERFLREHSADIRGRTLEMGDLRYTRKYGGERVARADVLHYIPGNPDATLVGDLVSGSGIPADTFDCMIVINTLLLIYDLRAAMRTIYQALRPGGVLLAHFTGVDRKSPEGPAWEADYWRFTSASVRRLCVEHFPESHVRVVTYGNVRTATAYLYGLAAEELRQDELDFDDPDYEVVICARAVRPLDERH